MDPGSARRADGPATRGSTGSALEREVRGRSPRRARSRSDAAAAVRSARMRARIGACDGAKARTSPSDARATSGEPVTRPCSSTPARERARGRAVRRRGSVHRRSSPNHSMPSCSVCSVARAAGATAERGGAAIAVIARSPPPRARRAHRSVRARIQREPRPDLEDRQRREPLSPVARTTRVLPEQAPHRVGAKPAAIEAARRAERGARDARDRRAAS